MMNLKKLCCFILSAVVLLPAMSGCTAFRDAFSRPPESMRRAPAKKKTPPPRRRGETGDKFFDTVFRRGKADDRPKFHSTELTPAEQRLVEGGLDALPRTAKDDPDMRRILDKDQKNRDARSREVYFPNLNNPRQTRE